MKIIGYGILLIVLLIGLIFSVLNSETVTVNYFIGKTTSSLSVVMVCSFAIGAILGLFVSLFAWVKLKTQLLLLRKKLHRYEVQTAALEEPVHE